MDFGKLFGEVNMSTVMFATYLVYLRDQSKQGVMFLSDLTEADAYSFTGLLIDKENVTRLGDGDAYEIVGRIVEKPNSGELTVKTVSEMLSKLAGRTIKMYAVHDDEDPGDVLGLVMLAEGPDGKMYDMNVPIF